MRTVAWFGNPFFCSKLEAHGWRVVFADRFPHLPLGWDDVVALAGGVPDLLVLGDRSTPPLLAGLERYPCPTLFYSVDSHIHAWHPLYARAFDLVLVSLAGHLPAFRKAGIPQERLLWSPPYARDEDGPLPNAVPEFGLLFVGSVNPLNAPGRAGFLAEVGRLVPGLAVRQGAYRELYARARVVLNEAERGDLNFRVFEALGCGACLLTPRVGHGLADLFADGRELFTYPPGDARVAAAKARVLLRNPDLCARAGAAGLAAADAGHRAGHRAATLARWLDSHDLPALVAARQVRAPALFRDTLRPLFLHAAEGYSAGDMPRRYLAAARGAGRPARS
ncbi:MAG: glycosyltransferase [Thermodesulfobacteriota bacterium]